MNAVSGRLIASMIRMPSPVNAAHLGLTAAVVRIGEAGNERDDDRAEEHGAAHRGHHR